MATSYQSSFSFNSFNECVNGQPAGMKLFLAQQLLNEAVASLAREERQVEAIFKSIVGDAIVKQEVSLDISQLASLLSMYYSERKADAKAKEVVRNANALAATKQS